MGEAKKRNSMQITLNDDLFYGYIYINILVCFIVNDSYLCAETIGDAHSIRITETYCAHRLAKQ